MLKIFKAALKYSPAVVGTLLVLGNSAIAGEVKAENVSPQWSESNNSLLSQVPASDEQIVTPLNSLESGESNESMDQLRSVNQLSDVRPTDWAYEALRNLVERYGCIAGYPDGTFRGNRALTRYEFAAGVNACLDAISGQIKLPGNIVRKEDLATLQRLLNEFQKEIAVLKGRLDSLEARTRTLEENQFSTTTKLKVDERIIEPKVKGEERFKRQARLGGEAIFAANDIIGDGGVDVNPFTSYRLRLNLNTSFTGKDLLLTRLQSGNTPNLGSIGDKALMDRLSFEADTASNLRLSKLYYRFPLGNATVHLDANDGAYNDNIFTVNPLLASDSQGTISRFGRFNPIYRQGGGQGATILYDFSKSFGIAAGYLANNGNTPSSNTNTSGGFFHGSYAALGQVTLRPSDAFAIAGTYVHSYHRNGRNLAGGTGSNFADSPFGTTPTTADHFGLEASFRASPRFALSGWAGYTKAYDQNSDNDATLWNWAVTLGLNDLGKKGNLLGFVVGMPPKVTGNDLASRKDGSTSMHYEAFYRYQITDNISITPGLFVLTNPDHNSSKDTDFVGTIRTTFSF